MKFYYSSINIMREIGGMREDDTQPFCDYDGPRRDAETSERTGEIEDEQYTWYRLRKGLGPR